MKIVAYSKIPSSTPFVHLGYLAASTTITKPVQGLLFGGIVILIAGLSVMGARLARQRKTTEAAEVLGLHVIQSSRIGLALLLLSGMVIWAAFAFGDKNRVFDYPQDATWTHMELFSRTAVNRFEPRNSHLTKPPTQEGQYDLCKALDLSGEIRKSCTDGWNTPLVLRVIRHEDQVEYVIVSAGPDRTLGTQDDLTSTELLKMRQIIDLPRG